MRKIHKLVYGFIFTILTLAVFLVGCGGSDADNVLCDAGETYCAGGCCPVGTYVKCSGVPACAATPEECGSHGVEEDCRS